MPRYRVTEKRAFTETTLIDAESEEAAKRYEGDIIDTSSTDSYGDELLGIEEADPEEDSA